MKRGVACGLMLGAAVLGWGQSDSVTDARAARDQRIHRTTLAAALVPGSGQVLNRKYWKVPIVVGGVWWAVSGIQFSAENFRTYRDALVWETDEDPMTANETGLTASELNDRALFYRRQRDVGVLALLGVHALAILDANVDAHLMEFDVSENLKAGIDVHGGPGGEAVWGVALRWDLAKKPHSPMNVHATW